ncbi:hypothetical protein MBLNU230_g3203t1 [Neophaeotheca triangularis]
MLHGRAKFKPFLDLNRIRTSVEIHTSAIRSLYREMAGYHEDYEFGMDLEQRLNDPETNFGGIDKVKGIWGNVQGRFLERCGRFLGARKKNVYLLVGRALTTCRRASK